MGLSFLSCAPIIRNPWASLTNVSIIISATVTIVPRSVKIKLYLAHSVLFCVVSSLLCPIAHMARIVFVKQDWKCATVQNFLPICEAESWRKKASGRLAKTVRHETIRRVRAYQISHLISLLRLFITYTLGRHPDVQLEKYFWFLIHGYWKSLRLLLLWLLINRWR